MQTTYEHIYEKQELIKFSESSST